MKTTFPESKGHSTFTRLVMCKQARPYKYCRKLLKLKFIQETSLNFPEQLLLYDFEGKRFSIT